MLPQLPQFAKGVGDMINIMCEIRDAGKLLYEVMKPSSHNRSKRVTTTDSYQTITLPFLAKRIDVITHDNRVNLQRNAIKGEQYDDSFDVDGGGYYSYNVWTAEIQVKSGVTGTPADVTLVFWD